MKSIRFFLLASGLAFVAMTNVFAMSDQNTLQVKADVQEAKEASDQVAPARKVVKLDSSSALFDMVFTQFAWQLTSTSVGGYSKNMHKVFLFADIALLIPEILNDELSADLYFGIKGLRGLAECGVACCLLERHCSGEEQFVSLILAVPYFGSGTDKLKKSATYFMTGEAKNLKMVS